MIKLVKMNAEINGNQSCFLKKCKLSKKKKQKYLIHRKVFQNTLETLDYRRHCKLAIWNSKKGSEHKITNARNWNKISYIYSYFHPINSEKKTELYGNHLFRVTSYWHLMQSKNLQHPNIFDSKCQKKRDEEIIIVIVYSKMNHFTRMDWVSMATN